MDKLDISNLPEELGDDYLILVSNDKIDISNLDKLLNSTGVITGLVNEYTSLSESDDFNSLLIRIDGDSVVNKTKLNRKITESIYVCDPKNYMEISNTHESSKESQGNFDLSDRSYGCNEMKVLMRKDGELVKLIMVIPFASSMSVLEQIAYTFNKTFKLSCGAEVVRNDINDDRLSAISLSFSLPLDKLSKIGRRNFDMMMNSLLSILNLDKYLSLEMLSSNDEIKSLLD